MSVEVYGKCHIQRYSPIGPSPSFDRCLIELRQYEVGDYALRAIDLNQHNSEIFNCRLVRRNQYIFGSSSDQPDGFAANDKTYSIQLCENSRSRFHEVLRTCLEDFLIVKSDDVLGASTPTPAETRSRLLLKELSKHEEEPYYRNQDPFDCLTCMETIERGDGILLSNCLHPLCKRCLMQMADTSTEPTINCPHQDCSALITERELRGVAEALEVDRKTVDRLNNISLAFVESRNKTLHCTTPDCTHWWFIEPEETSSLILCNGCKHWICTKCTAIHEGQTCHEYQQAKLLREANDNNVHKDMAHIEAMIKNKEVMYCPGCRVLIQKISGCDWIQCTQCKMEICWPTQGPRWGPKGRGDTSGGCRCRADNGKLCVPDCKNCH